jgi:hypothetical protein
MESCSITNECYIVNEDVVIKTGKINMMKYLEKKLNNHPVIADYLIPTFVYKLPVNHDLDIDHIHFMEKFKNN